MSVLRVWNRSREEFPWCKGRDRRAAEVPFIPSHNPFHPGLLARGDLEGIFKIGNGQRAGCARRERIRRADFENVEDFVDETIRLLLSGSFQTNVVKVGKGMPGDPSVAWMRLTPIQNRLTFIRKALAVQQNVEQDVGVDQDFHRPRCFSKR